MVSSLHSDGFSEGVSKTDRRRIKCGGNTSGLNRAPDVTIR